MGVTSTIGFKFKLVADGEILDLFKDEEIKITDNILGLFDLGQLPADFTRTITLPGSKKNNHFFEFVYDISVEDPYTFSTNQKVPCYLDFDGIYLSDGYMQLNAVNVYQNKYVDSYEVTIYGGLASFGRDLKRYFLTDLTSSLAKYNHTSSFANISSSWGGNLLSGSIVYPLAEYGQQLQYNNGNSIYGIQSPSGALCIQDFKPSIKVKDVWDACFEQFGYTYTSSFLSEPFWDNVYMLANNQLTYPVYPTSSYGLTDFDIETYGKVKIASISGSGFSNITMSIDTEQFLPWYNIQSNPANNIDTTNLDYSLHLDSKLRGNINLNFYYQASNVSNATVPQFRLIAKDIATSVTYSVELININNYLQQVKQSQTSNGNKLQNSTFELVTGFDTPLLPSGSYNFELLYYKFGSGTQPDLVVIDPNNENKSYLEITKVNQAGEGLVLNMANNMPYGTAGIKLIDFISSIQKKYNLVIYPNKTKLNQFIVEPFNRWYKTGTIKDFNKYINLDNAIKVTPANNLAVQNLNFGDTLDGDYISQQFAKGANHEFGKAYYVDQENFFSQGTFEVKTNLASSPLIYLAGTGVSGSTQPTNALFTADSTAIFDSVNAVEVDSSISVGTELVVTAIANADAGGPSVTTSNSVYKTIVPGSQINFAYSSNATATFTKIVDSIETSITNPYTVTQSDVSATTLEYKIVASN